MAVTDLTTFLQSDMGHRVIVTVGVLFVTLLVRAIILRAVRGSDRMSSVDRLRWTGHARSTSILIFTLATVFIWGSEVRDVLLSLVVLASAVVLATKELIMCVSGSLLRATTRAFEVGDRIEVDGIRGDVINLGVFGTTLLEIGPGHQRTGRTQIIPNSLFLSKPLANETFTQRFVLHSFVVPLGAAEWRDAETRLLAIASRVCGELLDDAKAQMDAVSSRHGLSTFDTAPRITVHIDKPGEVLLRLRVPSRARERGRVEQEILRAFLGTENAPTSRDVGA